MLMSNLGVPTTVFMELTKKTLSDMSQMFIDEKLAQSKMQCIACGVHWKELEEAGFDLTSEPYLRSMLMALYR